MLSKKTKKAIASGDYNNWTVETAREILTEYYEDKKKGRYFPVTVAQQALLRLRNHFGGLKGYENDGEQYQAGLKIMYDCGSSYVRRTGFLRRYEYIPVGGMNG